MLKAKDEKLVGVIEGIVFLGACRELAPSN